MQATSQMNYPVLGVFLSEELKRRNALDSRYSLRTFAKSLKISPSYLSMLINGQKQATAESILEITKKLEVSEELINYWLYLEKETSAQFFFKGRLDYFKPVTSSQYHTIRHWYHYAILELVGTKGFKASFHWIAQRLGIKTEEARDAVKNLSETGLLDAKTDQWKNISGTNSNMLGTSTTQDRKLLQREILQQSLTALDEIDFQWRDHSSMTVAIHPAKIPEAKEKIKQFRREMAAFLSSDETPEEVYQLHIGLFPISKKEDNHE